MNILKENKGILIVVIIVIALLVWYSMSNQSDSSSDRILSTTSSEHLVDDRELLQILTNMEKIRLDGRIFESDVYLSLQDFSRSIVPEPIGRPDPFAPLEAIEVTITSGGDLSDGVLLRE